MVIIQVNPMKLSDFQALGSIPPLVRLHQFRLCYRCKGPSCLGSIDDDDAPQEKALPSPGFRSHLRAVIGGAVWIHTYV